MKGLKATLECVLERVVTLELFPSKTTEIFVIFCKKFLFRIDIESNSTSYASQRWEGELKNS